MRFTIVVEPSTPHYRLGPIVKVYISHDHKSSHSQLAAPVFITQGPKGLKIWNRKTHDSNPVNVVGIRCPGGSFGFLTRLRRHPER